MLVNTVIIRATIQDKEGMDQQFLIFVGTFACIHGRDTLSPRSRYWTNRMVNSVTSIVHSGHFAHRNVQVKRHKGKEAGGSFHRMVQHSIQIQQ
mmetsp:Transcript_58275/g.112452  ORF Transcript_58275/g.112452 Transcript_58275/m.112452 type:complete len:94 (+) Transcript_58275:39-320(+)